MEPNFILPDDEDPDALAEDNTRPSLPEDFPNFRDFQIEKMVHHFRVVTDGSEQRLRLGFKCKLCNEVFNKTMQLLGHIRNHFEENHSCKDCGKYFFDTNKLNIHKRAKHTQALRCQLGCPNYTTSNIKCLQTHYLRYHCLKVRPREMKKMDALGTLFRPGDLENKIRTHREQLADRQRSLPVVVQQQLPQQQQVQPEAEEEFEDDDGEEEAVEQDHEPEPEEDEFDELDDFEQPVECCVCDTYIPNEEVLLAHEATHSSPFSCKICSSAFERLEDARNHYAAHEKPPVLQSPPQIQTITLTPPTLQQQLQHAGIPIVSASGQQPAAPTPTVATMIIMHNGTPMLVPVQTFDSSQLVPAAFPPQQATATQINPQSPATTITPITTAWPISQLLPVNNQIEIIPIHSTQPAASGSSSGGPAATMNPHHHQQAIPIQNIINLRHEHGAAAHPGGGIVITPVTAIDPNFLRQQQALQAQLQFQQQYQPQS